MYLMFLLAGRTQSKQELPVGKSWISKISSPYSISGITWPSTVTVTALVSGCLPWHDISGNNILLHMHIQFPTDSDISIFNNLWPCVIHGKFANFDILSWGE